MAKYRWKCQNCGLEFLLSRKGEPKICPMCRDKRCKTFYGKEERKN